MSLENRPENEKSPKKPPEQAVITLEEVRRRLQSVADGWKKIGQMEKVFACNYLIEFTFSDPEPFWIGPGYRGEYTCPHGVGHGRHVHGCCPESCCQRDDFPLNDANLEATRKREEKERGQRRHQTTE